MFFDAVTLSGGEPVMLLAVDRNMTMPRKLLIRCPHLFIGVVTTALLSFASDAHAQGLSLPNAPGFLQAASPQAVSTAEAAGRIRGMVIDVSGALVPGATIKLELKKNTTRRLGDAPKPSDLEDLYTPLRETIADSAGEFEFSNLAAGTYRALITAKGLEPFLSERIELSAGQHFELPNIALPVATAGKAVTVYATSVQVADAELKLETHQRVLGLAPNYYESFVWNAAPLNTRQKFYLATKSRTDPFIIIPTAIRAGIETGRDTFPGWGQDTPSYFKRFAAGYGDALFGRFIGGAIFPSIFHQDPRYFYMGPAQPTSARFLHAISAGVVARGDNGHLQPNYSHVFGNAAAGALSTVYHPAGTSAGSLAARNAIFGVAGGAIQGLFREFVFSRLTHNVPGYAKGKPAADPK
jgi:hypothetical protein